MNGNSIEDKIEKFLGEINNILYPHIYIEEAKSMNIREKRDYSDVNFIFRISNIGSLGIFADIYVFDFDREIKLEYSFILERYPEELKISQLLTKELQKSCFLGYKTTFRRIDDRYFPKPPLYEKTGILQ